MVGLIILAGGQGRRMLSNHPKILHFLGGLSVIGHVMEAFSGIQAKKICVVPPSLKQHPGFKDFSLAVQDAPQGTGDAVRVGLQALDSSVQSILIACGDTPLITPVFIETLMASSSACTVVGMQLPDPQKHLPYGPYCDLVRGIPRAYRGTS